MLPSHNPEAPSPHQNGARVLFQVSLYLLLMQERYGHVIESGLLWYLSHSSPQQVKLVPQELQSLMQARNWLAASIVPGQPLPPVIKDERACDKCFQKTVCALSHKVGFVRWRLDEAPQIAKRCVACSSCGSRCLPSFQVESWAVWTSHECVHSSICTSNGCHADRNSN